MPMNADEAIDTIHTFGYAEGRRLTLHAGDKATRRRAEAAIRLAFAVLEIVESLPPGDSAPCPAWIIHEAMQQSERDGKREEE